MKYIIRYGEIGTKGANRADFEIQLVENLRKKVKGKVMRRRGRLYIESDEPSESVIAAITKTCGVSSCSPGVETECAMDHIIKCASQTMEAELKLRKVKSFKVACRRLVKNLIPSQEICTIVGAHIADTYHLKVDCTKPDCTIGIEIHDKATIFTQVFQGPGGLPVGIEGTVAVLIAEPDALYSMYLMLKRGCRVLPIILDESNRKIADEICKRLEPFSPFPLVVHSVKDNEIAEFMIRRQASALVTAETFPDLREELVRPTFRPIIALPKEMKKKIDKITT